MSVVGNLMVMAVSPFSLLVENSGRKNLIT